MQNPRKLDVDMLFSISSLVSSSLLQLPASLLVSIFGTIRLGVTDFTPDVANACLDFVAGFATSISQSQGQAPPIVHQLVQPFLKLILEMTLLQPLDPEITTMAGSALFPLMCCYPVSTHCQISSADELRNVVFYFKLRLI